MKKIALKLLVFPLLLSAMQISNQNKESDEVTQYLEAQKKFRTYPHQGKKQHKDIPQGKIITAIDNKINLIWEAVDDISALSDILCAKSLTSKDKKKIRTLVNKRKDWADFDSKIKNLEKVWAKIKKVDYSK